MAKLDTARTHRLGGRAFLLFFGRGLVLTLLLAAAIAGIWWYGSVYVPKQYVIYYVYGLKLSGLLVAAYFVYKLAHAFFTYRSHEFRFDSEYFHITRGYLNRDEMGVVYHQIQTVSVQRPIGARMVGVAHLTIIASSGDNGGRVAHLPALDVRRARLVQKELLARARRQQHPEEARPRYQAVPFDEEDEDDE